MSESSKRLTVITTTYRSAAHLDLFLRGVLALDDIDVITVCIVMNDPDDVELAILAPYCRRYPGSFEVIEVPRESIGASVNRGLAAASTPYCAFLDVDDVRVPDSFTRQMAVLDGAADADFTYGDFMIVNKPGLTEGSRVETIEFDHREFTRGCHASPTQLFRRSLIDRAGGLDEQLRSGGDFEFQVRAALNCRFVKTPGLMVYKTNWAGSASSGHIQPLERTVVELRYGLYDKTIALNGLGYVEQARRYRLHEVLLGGVWHDICEFVPEYRGMLEARVYALGKLERRLVWWKRRRGILSPLKKPLRKGVEALRGLKRVLSRRA